MEGKAEGKKVKYRCRYCQKEYTNRDEFIEHKKSNHADEMAETSHGRPDQEGKKRSAPSTSLPGSQHTPRQHSSPYKSVPGISSTSPLGSPATGTSVQSDRKDEENVQSEEEERQGIGPSSKSPDRSSPVLKRPRKSLVEGSKNEKSKAVDKHTMTRLQSKPETRFGLRPRRNGNRVGTTQTTRKNMPMPYGQKVKKVGLDGKEREEWFRNPKMKGA